MDDATLRERLEEFLRGRLADAASVRVTALERSTEGFSAETFTFDVDVAHDGKVEKRAFVLKREPLAGLLEPYDLEPEFRVLHALSAHPLPSPPTPWLERDPAVLERSFYVMDRLSGDVPIPVAGPDGCGPFTETERASLGADVVDTLAQLHTVDWRGLGLGFLGEPGPGHAAATREVARWEDRIRRSELPLDPALAEALGWLRRHLPATSHITLVHGDYRLGNFLVARDGAGARLSGILDWELVHLGDPLEDVAWCTSELWRGGTAFASGVMLPEDFVERWARATGWQPDADRLHFYRVLAVVKMIAIMLTGLRAFRDGRTTDLRMAIFDHQLPYLHLLLGMLRGWMGGA